MVRSMHLLLRYCQQQILCLFTLFFVNMLGVKKSDDPGKLELIKIGKGLRELRGSANLRVVAERAGIDHAQLSRIERGGNTRISTLIAIVVDGLQMEFSAFCRYFVSEDRHREREELEAMRLLSSVMKKGPAFRRSAIQLLRMAEKPSLPDPLRTSKPDQ